MEFAIKTIEKNLLKKKKKKFTRKKMGCNNIRQWLY